MDAALASAPWRRAATAAPLRPAPLSALTVGAVLYVAHRGDGTARAAGAALARADADVQFAGADDNDYPSDIDDDAHLGCPGFEHSDVWSNTSCTDTDDGFCDEVKNDWCNGTMCEIFNVSGCSTCDGSFGACVMDALNYLPNICNKTGHGRRLASARRATPRAAPRGAGRARRSKPSSSASCRGQLHRVSRL